MTLIFNITGQHLEERITSSGDILPPDLEDMRKSLVEKSLIELKELCGKRKLKKCNFFRPKKH